MLTLGKWYFVRFDQNQFSGLFVMVLVIVMVVRTEI